MFVFDLIKINERITKKQSFSIDSNAVFDNDFVERSFQHVIFQFALIVFVLLQSIRRSRFENTLLTKSFFFQTTNANFFFDQRFEN